jgi:UDP-N-acetylmuramyl tripeptide synthase
VPAVDRTRESMRRPGHSREPAAAGVHGAADHQRHARPTDVGMVSRWWRRGRGSLRAWVAVGAGRMAGLLSRRLGLGDGAVIGGRLTLALDGGGLRRLSAGRRVVLVTGTNGKTTTAHLVAAALRTAGAVAHNDTGANMLDGVVAALTASPDASLAVLEVDELHLAQVAAAVDPAVVVLLNLTRDQLDRSTEVAAVAESIRGALQAQPQALVIANRDDPVVVAVVEGQRRVQWVAFGSSWLDDAVLCPRCGEPLSGTGVNWSCSSCGLRRPDAQWRFGDGVIEGPDSTVPLVLQLPGKHNQGNAAAATAAAAALGVAPTSAAAAIAGVRSVAHRYAVVERGAQQLTLLLAKNPASWRQTLPLLENADALLLAVNAREADGRDTSWLWDIPFENVPPCPVVASGDAAPDVGLRLFYAGVEHRTVADPLAALEELPSGEVAVVANYTAFTDLWQDLERTAGP